MKQKKPWGLALFLLLAVVVIGWFSLSVSRVERDHRAEGKQQLEDVLRRTAAACYAAEGAYPPDLEYMCRKYGIHYDAEQYTVYYQPVASNLMPDITVLEQVP